MRKPALVILITILALLLLGTSVSSQQGSATFDCYGYSAEPMLDSAGIPFVRVTCTQGEPPTPEPTLPPPTPVPTGTPLPPAGFLETFDGDPAAPAYPDLDWDITRHLRNVWNWGSMPPMDADHGPGCEPPPNTHVIIAYEEMVYGCKNHVMTAINGEGYGAVVLTPPTLLDLSQGTATVSFDMSTFRASTRDWADLWITPLDKNLVVPLFDWLPDGQGEPAEGILMTMTLDTPHSFVGYRAQNHTLARLPVNSYTEYSTLFEPSRTQRQTFVLELSHTHVRFGLPDYNLWWVDTELDPPLPFDTALVQLGHHSYNPTKVSGGLPGTWHWDNVAVNPARPLTIVGTLERIATPMTPTLTLESPAPAGAWLRFEAIGLNMTVNGEPAMLQDQELNKDGRFRNYWMPVPEGTTTLTFGGDNWWYGDWHVRNVSVIGEVN